MTTLRQIFFRRFKIENVNHHEQSDLRYVFRLFYKQSPGSINLYQNLFRYYDDEVSDVQTNYDSFQTMKSRILKHIEQ